MESPSTGHTALHNCDEGDTMTRRVLRNATATGGATALLGLVLCATPAAAAEPLPAPSAGPLGVLTQAAASPSPTPGPLDPVVDVLPEPVRSPVKEVADTLFPKDDPPPPPAPPAPPGSSVGANGSSSPVVVAGPASSSFADLSAGSFPRSGSMSGFAPLSSGMAPSFSSLFRVPDVTTPTTAPVTAVQVSRPLSLPTAPGGLPALLVVVALVTVGGAAAGQVAVVRRTRTSAA